LLVAAVLNSRLTTCALAKLTAVRMAPDCGHIVHLNQPDRLHAAIGDFIAGER
jgi:pimeloyl-ACP methyl ester carboxylesterase